MLLNSYTIKLSNNQKQDYTLAKKYIELIFHRKQLTSVNRIQNLPSIHNFPQNIYQRNNFANSV